MKRFTITLLLSLFLSSPANAFVPGSGLFTDMEFLTETQIPGPGGDAMALCYATRDFRILGYTLSSDIVGYVLSSDNCVDSADRPFTKEQMETAQSLKLVDANLPSEARNSLERDIRSYGIWIAIALGLIAVIIRRIKSLMGLDLRGPMRKKSSQRILTALCYVGKCDGIVTAAEIALIGKTASRLTRRSIKAAEVIRITDRIDMNLSEQDFIDFGKGLRDSEKDVMMRGAFYIALSNGRILPSEHQFLSDLAHGIGMPGEDFRRVMNIALTDLDDHPAS